MPRNQYAPQLSVAYYFSRSKDVHEEDGETSITLFARLTKEFTYENHWDCVIKAETVWVDIEDIKIGEATEKMRNFSNSFQKYTLSESVFLTLYQLSKSCPRELYFLTPLHQESVRQKFIT